MSYRNFRGITKDISSQPFALLVILSLFAVIPLISSAQEQVSAGTWRFDDGFGVKAADSSGNNHAATLVNGVTWVAGHNGKAISATSSKRQYVSIPAIDLSATKAVTVTLWTKRVYSTIGGHVLFEATANSSTSTTGFSLFPDDNVCAGMAAGLRGDAGDTVNCYSQPSSNIWHHLALVFDKSQTGGNQVKLYVDGVLRNPTRSLSAASNTNKFGKNPIYLFSRGGTAQFDSGSVADFQVFAKALSASQVKQNLVTGLSQIGKDVLVSVDATDTMTTPSFTTSFNAEPLFAFVAYDGPSSSAQTATVSGGGLTWKLVERCNHQFGTAEIWTATAPNAPFTGTVTSKPGYSGGYHGSLTVIGFTNAAGFTVINKASGTTGAPDVNLQSVTAGSWVFSVGNDWDNAIPRTPVSGQTLVHQRVDTVSNDTYWVQSTTAPSTSNGSVDIHDSVPTTDQWNYSAVTIAPKQVTNQGTLSASPTSINFGNVDVQTSLSRTITVTNTGNATVNVSGVTASGTGFSVSGVTPPFSLLAGQSVSITASFAPAILGTASGSVTITSNATNPTLSIPLTGTGVSTTQGTLSASPTSVSFGNVNVNSSLSRSITVTNIGAAAVNVSGVSVAGQGFSFSGVTPPFTIAAGQHVSITATFSPTTTGTHNGSIVISSNASNSSLAIPLTGTGVSNSQHGVTLSWTASLSQVVGYNVYRATSSNGSYTKLNTGLVTATTYKDAAVQDGLTYYYVTTAVNAQGLESIYSNQASATVP